MSPPTSFIKVVSGLAIFIMLFLAFQPGQVAATPSPAADNYTTNVYGSSSDGWIAFSKPTNGTTSEGIPLRRFVAAGTALKLYVYGTNGYDATLIYSYSLTDIMDIEFETAITSFFVVSHANGFSIFSLDSSVPIYDNALPGKVRVAKLSADGNYCVIGTQAGKVILYHKENYQNWQEVWSYQTYSGIVRDVAIDNDGNHVAAVTQGADGTLGGNRLYSWFTSTTFTSADATPDWQFVNAEVKSPLGINSMISMTAGGSRMVVGSYDNKFHFFNTEDNTPIWTYTIENTNFWGNNTTHDFWHVDISEPIGSSGGPATYEIVAAGNNGTSIIYHFLSNSSTPDWIHYDGCTFGVQPAFVELRGMAVGENGFPILVGGYAGENMFFSSSATPFWTFNTNYNISGTDQVRAVAMTDNGDMIAWFTGIENYDDTLTIMHTTQEAVTPPTQMLIDITPAGGPVGTIVTITGQGFTANGTVFISTSAAFMPYITATTDDNGDFTKQYVIPSNQLAGTVDNFQAIDNTTLAYSNIVTFTITATDNTITENTPTITIDPTIGPIGTPVAITGFGFTPNTLVYIATSYAFEPYVTTTSSVSGTIAASFQIGEGNTPGAKDIYAVDSATMAHSNTVVFTVTASTPDVTFNPVYLFTPLTGGNYEWAAFFCGTLFLVMPLTLLGLAVVAGGRVKEHGGMIILMFAFVGLMAATFVGLWPWWILISIVAIISLMMAMKWI